jgi:hypothetical protein
MGLPTVWIITGVTAVVVIAVGALLVYYMTKNTPHPTPGGMMRGSRSLPPGVECPIPLGMVCSSYDQGVATLLPEANEFCRTNAGARMVILTPDGHTQLANSPLICKNNRASFLVPSNALFYPDVPLKWILQAKDGNEICTTIAPPTLSYNVCE